MNLLVEVLVCFEGARFLFLDLVIAGVCIFSKPKGSSLFFFYSSKGLSTLKEKSVVLRSILFTGLGIWTGLVCSSFLGKLPRFVTFCGVTSLLINSGLTFP